MAQRPSAQKPAIKPTSPTSPTSPTTKNVKLVAPDKQNHTSTTPLEDMSASRAVNSNNQCLKVFVQRDYNEGTLVKFQTRFPTELEDRMVEKLSHHRSGIPVEFDGVLEHLLVNIKFRAVEQMFLIHGGVWHLAYCALTRLIERQAFEYTVNQLNAIYAEAEKAGCGTYCKGCMACLTAYLVYICTETHYEKCLRKVAKFVVEQNERVYAPRGLLITDPTERGLRVIEISILNEPAATRT